VKSPLVTVYITNYNYGRYIQQAIESVLNQTFNDFELCIIDDGSTDNSKEVIEAYGSLPNVQIIYQLNKGLNISNNIALRIAKGKYIMRLDADDYLVENALEEMVNALEADSSVAMVFPDYFLVNEENKRIGHVRRFNFREEVTLPDLPAHGACTMVRKELLLDIGGYDEQFTCQDGYDLWLKFITKYKVENINKPLFHYRRHGKNLTENEQRILDARRGIKNAFIQSNKLEVPKAVAVIPVRPSFINKQNLALVNIGRYNMLERTARAALQSKYISDVIITSSDADVELFCQQELSKLSRRVKFVKRPAKYSRYNETLGKTILNVLQAQDNNADAIVNLAPEFPFIKYSSIDDALQTLAIFQCDSLISVRSDTRTYYRHTGDGLKPILEQDRFTQFEREALYKAVGGITVCRTSSFMKYKNMQCGKVGHIIIDNEQAHGIFNEFDLQVAQLVAASKEPVSENIYS
jgi:CMP-N-acetylneuraminic acid synthetase